MDIDSLMPVPYLVHLLVLLVSFGVIFLVYKFRSSSIRGNLPPGIKGLPYIGETLDYMLSHMWGTPGKFFTNRMMKYSPDVFRTSLLGEDVAVFCGAEGNKFLFSGQNKYVTVWWPDSVKKTVVDEVVEIRGDVLSLLKSESLKHYIPIMDMVAKEHLDRYWSPNEKVRVFPVSMKFALALSCRIFMSIQDQEIIERFSTRFVVLANGLISMPIDLPGTAFNRAVKAGKQIRQELLGFITKKKNELLEKGKSTTGASDLVDKMLTDGMREVEIGNKIVSFLFASHDTVSTVITFVVSYLADYPDIYNKVLEEHMDILNSKEQGETLRMEDIQKMKYTWCVACEVMRLAPPTIGSFREAITDFTYAGYTIPKGWKAFWTVQSTHKNSKYFPDPEKFDPSRFEGKGPAPYTFVPFGGGPRMCPGKEFARLEILIFIHNLVTRFKWKKLNPNEKISYIHSPVPNEGLPIKIQPISIN